MDLCNPTKKIATETLTSRVLPAFYKDKCGKYLYPFIPGAAGGGPFSKSGVGSKLKRLPQTRQSEAPSDGSMSKRNDSTTFKKFDQRLQKGILAIPYLNLVQIPSSIFEFRPPIRFLYLSYNNLETLPDNLFDDLPELIWSDLRNNQLISTASLSKSHPNLRTLLLSNNQITKLETSLFQAQNLQTLHLHENPILFPPQNILEAGVKSILKYLQTHHENPQVVTDDEQYESEVDIDTDSIIQSYAKDSGNFRNQSMKSISQTSIKETPTTNTIKTIYSDGFWRYVPYLGPQNVLTKTKEEIKRGIEKKLNCEKGKLLQKMKDAETRRKFQWKSHQLQLNGEGDKKAQTYGGLNLPFGIECSTTSNQKSKNEVSIDKFHANFANCWDRLANFVANPISIQNTQEGMKRLKEIEDIHQQLANMKLSMQIPI